MGGKGGKCEEYWKEKMEGNWVKSEEKGKIEGKMEGKRGGEKCRIMRRNRKKVNTGGGNGGEGGEMGEK